MNMPMEMNWMARLASSRNLIRISSLVGALIFFLMLLLALFPSTFAPYDAKELVSIPLQRPSDEFIFGTNDLGQDLFSELIAGTRASLFTGVIVSFIAVVLGTAVGNK